MNKIKDCTNCINYKTVSCPLNDKTLSQKRRMVMQMFEDYKHSCWQDEWNKQLCEMMCGKENY